MQQLTDRDQMLLYRKKEKIKNILFTRFGPEHFQFVESQMPNVEKKLIDGQHIDEVTSDLQTQIEGRSQYNKFNHVPSETNQPRSIPVNKRRGFENEWGAVLAHQDEMQRIAEDEAKRRKQITLRQYREELDALNHHKAEQYALKKQRFGEKTQKRQNEAEKIRQEEIQERNEVKQKNQAIIEENQRNKQMRDQMKFAAHQKETEQYHNSVTNEQIADLRRDLDYKNQQMKIRQDMLLFNDQLQDDHKTNYRFAKELEDKNLQTSFQNKYPDRHWEYREKSLAQMKQSEQQGYDPRFQGPQYQKALEDERKAEEAQQRYQTQLAQKEAYETNRRIQLQQNCLDELSRQIDNRSELKRIEKQEKEDYNMKLKRVEEMNVRNEQDRRRKAAEIRNNYRIDLMNQTEEQKSNNHVFDVMNDHDRRINNQEILNFKANKPIMISKLPGYSNPGEVIEPRRMRNRDKTPPTTMKNILGNILTTQTMSTPSLVKHKTPVAALTDRRSPVMENSISSRSLADRFSEMRFARNAKSILK